MTSKRVIVPKASYGKIISLKEQCLDIVVGNFSKIAIEKEIPINVLPVIIKRLNFDLPPLVSLQYIADDEVFGNIKYWQNCCYFKYPKYDCNVEEHGNSWKRLYFEKLITERLESFEADVNELGNSIESQNTYDSNNNLMELLLLVQSTSDVTKTLHYKQLPSHLDIAEVISKLPNLEKIDVKYEYKNIGMDYDRLIFGMKVSDATYLAQALPMCRNLLTLKLSENLIDDDILRIVMTGVINNNSITYLDLSHNQIGNHGARYISKILDGDSSILEHLDLSNNKISSEGGKYLARSIRSGGKLRRLNLRLNKLGDDGCSLIIEGLLDNPYLEYLNISANKAESQSAEALVNLVRCKDSQLKEVDVTNNNFTAAHIVQFQKALDKNTNIHWFDLRMNPGYANLEENDSKYCVFIQFKFIKLSLMLI